MTPKELYGIFRLEVDDLVAPFLWSATEFYTYLTEAQERHVHEVGGIADRTSAFTKITYKENEKFVKFDSRIIQIKGAWDENNKRISIKNLDNFEAGFQSDDYGAYYSTSGLDDGLTGEVKILVTDVEDGKIQLYPLPDHTGYVQLYVSRRPLADVTATTECLEIPPQWHLNLLNWVKYKCYSKQDGEVFDGKKAAEFRMEFTNGVEAAMRDKSKRQDRARSVSYGGIPMS